MHNLFPHFSYVPLITSILVSAIIGLISYFIVFKLKYFKILEENPLVPPYISATTGILVLLLAFMASAAWQNSSIAQEALQRENMAIRRLHDLPLEPPELKKQAENKLDKYIQLVQYKEWGAYKNTVRLAEVQAVCKQLSDLTWKMNTEAKLNSKSDPTGSSSIITTEYIKWLEQLETARDKRLSLGRLSQWGFVNKWIFIYLLTLASAVSIAAVHRAKRKTAIIALVIFCSAIAIAYSMISLHMHPYKGPEALEPLLPVFTNGHSQGVR